MNLKRIKIPKRIKTNIRRFKWEDEIKKAGAEWEEMVRSKK